MQCLPPFRSLKILVVEDIVRVVDHTVWITSACIGQPNEAVKALVVLAHLVDADGINKVWDEHKSQGQEIGCVNHSESFGGWGAVEVVGIRGY